jgi:hypothetical protein
MPKSSALRREELVPASTPITIDGQGVPSPRNAEIANDGSVTFNAAQPWWLWFSPTGVFGDSQGLLQLGRGPNGPYDPQQPNVTVSYCVAQPNNRCTPSALKTTPEGKHVGNGGNTIKVG